MATTEPDFWAHCPAPDLAEPTLQGLAWLLEREDDWRNKIMRWEFSSYLYQTGHKHCGTAGCAMGLAHITWDKYKGPEGSAESLTVLMDEIISILRRRGENEDTVGAAMNSVWHDLFHNGSDLFNASQVTPRAVSDRIKAFLSNKPIPK